jgi:hypothetical protein
MESIDLLYDGFHSLLNKLKQAAKPEYCISKANQHVALLDCLGSIPQQLIAIAHQHAYLAASFNLQPEIQIGL